MADNEDSSLIPLPDGSLANTAAGVNRILSAMVGDTLALTRQEQASIQPARRKIGECEFFETDYWQILIWAKALSLEPEEVIKRLLQCGTVMVNNYNLLCAPVPPGYFDERLSETLAFTSTLFAAGKKEPADVWESFKRKFGKDAKSHLEILRQDLEKADHLTRYALDWNALYAQALYEQHLADFKSGREYCSPLKIRELRWYFDLLPLSNFEWVDGLDVWVCAEFSYRSEQRFQVDTLSPILPDVRRLECIGLGLKELDLSGVQRLEHLKCDGNDISVLDVRPLSRLKTLNYDFSTTRLIQRPDQHF